MTALYSLYMRTVEMISFLIEKRNPGPGWGLNAGYQFDALTTELLKPLSRGAVGKLSCQYMKDPAVITLSLGFSPPSPKHDDVCIAVPIVHDISCDSAHVS